MTPTVLKLVSGETIIAEVIEGSVPNNCQVRHPYIIRSGISDTNKMVLSLMPWIESEQHTFNIKEDHIISRAAPSKVVEQHYHMFKKEEEEAELFDDWDEEDFLDEDLDEEKVVH